MDYSIRCDEESPNHPSPESRLIICWVLQVLFHLLRQFPVWPNPITRVKPKHLLRHKKQCGSSQLCRLICGRMIESPSESSLERE